MSPELSEQLVAVAVGILVEEGWGRLDSDRIAARAGPAPAPAQVWTPVPGDSPGPLVGRPGT